MREARKIPNYSDIYTVTDCGIVYTTSGDQKRQKSVFIDKKGYGCITLSAPRLGKGKSKMIRIHKIVASAWIPNPENKLFVLHRDDNKSNNNISNLYWGDYFDNARDSARNGKAITGERCNFSKLKTQDVLWIRGNYKKIGKQCNGQEISDKFNMSLSGIMKVIRRNTWKHIPPAQGRE